MNRTLSHRKTKIFKSELEIPPSHIGQNKICHDHGDFVSDKSYLTKKFKGRSSSFREKQRAPVKKTTLQEKKNREYKKEVKRLFSIELDLEPVSRKSDEGVNSIHSKEQNDLFTHQDYSKTLPPLDYSENKSNDHRYSIRESVDFREKIFKDLSDSNLLDSVKLEYRTVSRYNVLFGPRPTLPTKSEIVREARENPKSLKYFDKRELVNKGAVRPLYGFLKDTVKISPKKPMFSEKVVRQTRLNELMDEFLTHYLKERNFPADEALTMTPTMTYALLRFTKSMYDLDCKAHDNLLTMLPGALKELNYLRRKKSGKPRRSIITTMKKNENANTIFLAKHQFGIGEVSFQKDDTMKYFKKARQEIEESLHPKKQNAHITSAYEKVTIKDLSKHFN